MTGVPQQVQMVDTSIYNTKFIDSLTPKEAEFLFGHEVLHNVFEHMLVRIGDRDPQLWNIAADYAVNQILKDQQHR